MFNSEGNKKILFKLKIPA